MNIFEKIFVFVFYCLIAQTVAIAVNEFCQNVAERKWISIFLVLLVGGMMAWMITENVNKDKK